MVRWPLHPLPQEHESLSSWLKRIAECYELSQYDLQVLGLGRPSLTPSELDVDPPEDLLIQLEKKTGVPLMRIRAMSLIGYIPLLIDTLTPQDGLLETYVSQFRTLIPPSKKKKYTVGRQRLLVQGGASFIGPLWRD